MQSGVALTDLTYQYGPDGQLSTIVDQLDPSKSKFISYDALNRLVQVDQGLPPIEGGVPVPVEDYAYDEEGNRTASHLSALYSSNAHNQLEEDEAYSYAYDPRGNRVSKTSKATGAVETYAYDSLILRFLTIGPDHFSGGGSVAQKLPLSRYDELLPWKFRDKSGSDDE